MVKFKQLAPPKWKSLVKRLSHREREIIELRYGLKDGFVYTLQEIGDKYKLTRERIRQIQKEALRKIELMQAQKDRDRP